MHKAFARAAGVFHVSSEDSHSRNLALNLRNSAYTIAAVTQFFGLENHPICRSEVVNCACVVNIFGVINRCLDEFWFDADGVPVIDDKMYAEWQI